MTFIAPLDYTFGNTVPKMFSRKPRLNKQKQQTKEILFGVPGSFFYIVKLKTVWVT